MITDVFSFNRNFGLSDIDIKYQVNTLRHQKNEFKMSVGNHSATVICKNKREGKQRASQSILQVTSLNFSACVVILSDFQNVYV